ncbi:hypothetical protein EON70_00605 [bacterium]|nr:MAG: hypothetical protein EON70_00605 [bacterium]
MNTNTTSIFFNHSFDKKKLKAFIYWVLKTFGEKDALIIVEELKRMGFYNATKAGLSIGLHDLKTPLKKKSLISRAEITMNKTDQEFQGAELTATERSQRIIDTWHRTSEDLRKQVVDYFSTYDQLNSVYMMALSGARGNFSQVRQLIGMRGLMADPQGQIISFPIRSNLREGLTLTEYFISCSGARKGLVDTALRTADTGYLTRRLVDISHHIVIKKVTCYTSRGIALKALRTSQKILLPLKDRLVGRVLCENIYDELAAQENGNQNPISNKDKLSTKTSFKPKASIVTVRQNNVFVAPVENKSKKIIARKNQEISPDLANKISLIKENLLDNNHSKKKVVWSTPSVLVRSPLTCTYTHELCQLCYGWSMAQGSLVSLGEAVGVIAGQSIGEPGTQLTMRTFHTGGVFSGDLLQEIRAPHSGKICFPKALQGLLIRTSQGKIAFLIKVPGELLIDSGNIDSQFEDNRKQAQLGYSTGVQQSLISVTEPRHVNKNKGFFMHGSQNKKTRKTTKLSLEPSTILFVRQGEKVESNQILAELAITSEEGNQPIQSRQTLFSERKGRIVQWKSMLEKKHRTKGKQSLNVKKRSFVTAQTPFSYTSLPSKRKKIAENQEVSYTNSSQLVKNPVFITESLAQKKPSIKAYLGPVENTSNYFERTNLSYSTLNTLNSYNKSGFGEVNPLEIINAQHCEDMSSNLKNLTVKQVVLSKKHGLGSIEPPKALQLGLLSVIASRIGASEKTCTKGIIHSKLNFEQSLNLRSNLEKKIGLSDTNKIIHQYYFNQTKKGKKTFFSLIPALHPFSFDAEKTKKLPYFNAHLTGLQHLNTIAEEGDLVDENYTEI